MKPGAEVEPNVVVVLDSKPELKVVFDAIEDIDFLRSRSEPTITDPEAFRGSTVYRFRGQTRDTQHINIAGGEPPGFVDVEHWAYQPKFDIRVEDIDFIKAAAQRTLAEHSPGELVWNVLTGRRRAAKAILGVLEDK